MQRQLMMTACLLSGLMLTSCSQPGDAADRTSDQMKENDKEMAAARKEGAEEWREERDEAARELRELREDLVSKKQREEKRLADGIEDATKKTECEARIDELAASIRRVDTSVKKVEGSSGRDWDEAKREARKTVDDTKNWIQREAEKIDWKTDADADDDGH